MIGIWHPQSRRWTIGLLAKCIREIWKLVCHFFVSPFKHTIHTHTHNFCKPSACFPSPSLSPWPGRSFPATPLWQHPSSKTRPSGPRFLPTLLKSRLSMKQRSRNGPTLQTTAHPSLPTSMAAIPKTDTKTSLQVLHTYHNKLSINHTAKLTTLCRMLAQRPLRFRLSRCAIRGLRRRPHHLRHRRPEECHCSAIPQAWYLGHDRRRKMARDVRSFLWQRRVP
jgi:hypothetical protein